MPDPFRTTAPLKQNTIGVEVVVVERLSCNGTHVVHVISNGPVQIRFRLATCELPCVDNVEEGSISVKRPVNSLAHLSSRRESVLIMSR